MSFLETIGEGVLYTILFLIIIVIVCLLIGFPLMWLWNWIAAGMFGAPIITFWKAVGLSFLIRMLYPTPLNQYTKK